jgi:hypothetical protein
MMIEAAFEYLNAFFQRNVILVILSYAERMMNLVAKAPSS